MTIVLPRMPRNTAYTLRPVRQAEVQRAAAGGARLPINRTGDHWSVEVDTGALGIVCARELLADILRGAGEMVRVYIPQPGIDTGAPGTPRVKGADQAGSSLIVDGLTPYFAVRKGWFVTVVTDGVGRPYLVTGVVIADNNGEATLPLWPMLHVQPADNDVVEIAEPFLDGLIVEGGDESSGLLPVGVPDSFLIEEQD